MPAEVGNSSWCARIHQGEHQSIIWFSGSKPVSFASRLLLDSDQFDRWRAECGPKMKKWRVRIQKCEDASSNSMAQ
jgi:hypothetical protein